MIKVYARALVSDDDFANNEQELRKYAQKSTLEKIDTYKSIKNKQRKLMGEMLAFKALKESFNLSDEEIIFTYGEKGKPMLKDSTDKFFNISHSGKWVICAVSDKEVGIDIEIIKKAKLNVASRFFTPLEIKALNSLEGDQQNALFFTFWTVKESYLKYLGTGLTKPLSSFDVIIKNDIITVNESKLSQSLHFSLLHLDTEYKLILCSSYQTDKETVKEC
jgi:4'-phosphopantetheinyl transferase